MNAKQTLNKVKTLLGLEVALEQMKLDNGAVIEAEAFAPDNEVFVVSGEDRVAIPIGEYTLEDGRILVVAQEGIIAEIKEAATEEPAEEEATEPEMEAQPEAPTTPKKVIESISKEMFFSEMEKLRAELLEKINLSKEVKVEEVELAKEEEVKPIKHNPEAKAKKDLNLYAQKRQMTTQDRVFQKLFNN